MIKLYIITKILSNLSDLINIIRARARNAHAHAEIYIAKVINKNILKYIAKVKNGDQGANTSGDTFKEMTLFTQ